MNDVPLHFRLMLKYQCIQMIHLLISLLHAGLGGTIFCRSKVFHLRFWLQHLSVSSRCRNDFRELKPDQ